MFSGILRCVCFFSTTEVLMKGLYPVLRRPRSVSYRLDLFRLATGPGICLGVIFLFEADLVLDGVEQRL
jgi:hypothetical protein